MPGGIRTLLLIWTTKYCSHSVSEANHAWPSASCLLCDWTKSLVNHRWITRQLTDSGATSFPQTLSFFASAVSNANHVQKCPKQWKASAGMSTVAYQQTIWVCMSLLIFQFLRSSQQSRLIGHVLAPPTVTEIPHHSQQHHDGSCPSHSQRDTAGESENQGHIDWKAQVSAKSSVTCRVSVRMPKLAASITRTRTKEHIYNSKKRMIVITSKHEPLQQQLKILKL